ncbi:hypothetical protein LCGC14_1619850, partial [marine sediment metagenome]
LYNSTFSIKIKTRNFKKHLEIIKLLVEIFNNPHKLSIVYGK